MLTIKEILQAYSTNIFNSLQPLAQMIQGVNERSMAADQKLSLHDGEFENIMGILESMQQEVNFIKEAITVNTSDIEQLFSAVSPDQDESSAPEELQVQNP